MSSTLLSTLQSSAEHINSQRGQIIRKVSLFYELLEKFIDQYLLLGEVVNAELKPEYKFFVGARGEFANNIANAVNHLVTRVNPPKSFSNATLSERQEIKSILIAEFLKSFMENEFWFDFYQSSLETNGFIDRLVSNLSSLKDEIIGAEELQELHNHVVELGRFKYYAENIKIGKNLTFDLPNSLDLVYSKGPNKEKRVWVDTRLMEIFTIAAEVNPELLDLVGCSTTRNFGRTIFGGLEWMLNKDGNETQWIRCRIYARSKRLVFSVLDPTIELAILNLLALAQ